jgi:hypothetical protein
VTDFLDEKRKEISSRLSELKPLVDEYDRLEAAASALAGVGGSTRTATAAPRRRGPGRPRGSSVRSTAAPSTAAPAKATRKIVGRRPGRSAGRRKGSGQRGTEALALIQGQPGIAVPEIATRMGIKQNYLYRVLPGLEKDGKVVKQGRGWHPKLV